MKTIDVYERYFEGECVFNGVRRRAAVVKLTAESDNGNIRYEVSVSFFPHEDEFDYAISYDAYSSIVIYDGKGRRSKKKEAAYLDRLTSYADELAHNTDGKIYWDKPLIEERRG